MDALAHSVDSISSLWIELSHYVFLQERTPKQVSYYSMYISNEKKNC